jgi:hypothetical protein
MLVPEDMLSCCVFVGHKMADGTEVWRGTAFFVSRPGKKPGLSFRYTVTAAHVIRKIAAKGVEQVLLRCNKKGGGVHYEETKASDWLLHRDRDNCDVAVLIGAPSDEWDIKVLGEDFIVPHAALSADDISVGTDVFWIGLFTNHVGTTRNEPLVRFGRIAALPADGVQTELGRMSAYLIDGVPLGGFSGSPVYSNHGTLRAVEGVIRTANSPIVRLIGMMHGHFNIDQATVEGKAAAEDMAASSIHTGIGVVIRADDIVEMLSHPSIREAEKRLNDAAPDIAD